jgi:hypothetical protein
MNKEAKDFPLPLNEWTTENVQVTKLDYDEKNNKMRVIDTLEERRVKYVHAPKEKFRCRNGDHVFRVVDKGRYIFSCKKCQYSKVVYPTTYRVTPEGHIIHLQTGNRI